LARIISEKRIGHIFRDAPGHVKDTPENRQRLLELVEQAENFLGTDARGHSWYVSAEGQRPQLWAVVRGDEIINGGANDAPRSFDPESGLARKEKSR